MATARRDAQTIMNNLVREQNYLVMMRPADPQPETPTVPQEELRVAHHDYLVDLERRGFLCCHRLHSSAGGRLCQPSSVV